MKSDALDALEALEKAATPGPWTKRVMGGVVVGELRENTLQFASGGNGDLFEIESDAGAYVNEFGLGEEDKCEERAHRDERLIAGLRNAAPALLARARRANELEFEIDVNEDTPESAAFWRRANGRWTDWAEKVLGYRVDPQGIMPGDDGQRERIEALLKQGGKP